MKQYNKLIYTIKHCFTYKIRIYASDSQKPTSYYELMSKINDFFE